MKQIINTRIILLFFYLSFSFVDCHQSNGSEATTYQLSTSPTGVGGDQCPLWQLLNPTTKLCECYDSPSVRNIVKCTEQGIAVRVGYCMTFEEQERTIYSAICNFDGNFSIIGNGRYIELPMKNVSELNDYMCGPMNRKGRLCSECIEGFGPSIISFRSVCFRLHWSLVWRASLPAFGICPDYNLFHSCFVLPSEHNFSSNGSFCIFQPSNSCNISKLWH